MAHLRAVLAFMFLVSLLAFALVRATPHQQAGLRFGLVSQSFDPYPSKPRVTFDAKGQFKLTVFSDLHYGEGEDVSWGPEQDIKSARVMRQSLDEDRPDYVVINGDLITGENTYAHNSTDYVNILLDPLIKSHVPFSCTYGNHDNNPAISHLLELEREQNIAPDYSYTRRAPPGIGGDGGEINYWVPVYANKKDSAPALILWFFDSRSGSSYGENSTQLPDWVDESVAGWIQKETTLMDLVWGDATSTGRQALAFVHIPPSIMQDLQKTLNSTKEPGLNADNLGSGSAQATNHAADKGKDLPWWNAVTTYITNLHAIVHGHDHGNEWCARSPSTPTILCFDKHTGYGGYSSDGWGYGVRTFQLSLPRRLSRRWWAKDKGTRTTVPPARTYIRMEDGSVHADVILDDKYGV